MKASEMLRKGTDSRVLTILGAMIIGSGWTAENPTIPPEVLSEFHAEVENPITHQKGTLMLVAGDLNGSPNWSFEEIADWLESINH